LESRRVRTHPLTVISVSMAGFPASASLILVFDMFWS